MEITLVVCNVCGDKNADTQKYELKQGRRKVAVDLCAAHGEPFEALLGDRPTPAKKAAPAPSGRPRASRVKVTTMEEIEKLKGK